MSHAICPSPYDNSTSINRLGLSGFLYRQHEASFVFYEVSPTSGHGNESRYSGLFSPEISRLSKQNPEVSGTHRASGRVMFLCISGVTIDCIVQPVQRTGPITSVGGSLATVIQNLKIRTIEPWGALIWSFAQGLQTTYLRHCSVCICVSFAERLEQLEIEESGTGFQSTSVGTANLLDRSRWRIAERRCCYFPVFIV